MSTSLVADRLYCPDKTCVSQSVHIPPFDAPEPEGAGLLVGPVAEGPEIEGDEVQPTAAVELGD